MMDYNYWMMWDRFTKKVKMKLNKVKILIKKSTRHPSFKSQTRALLFFYKKKN